MVCPGKSCAVPDDACTNRRAYRSFVATSSSREAPHGDFGQGMPNRALWCRAGPPSIARDAPCESAPEEKNVGQILDAAGDLLVGFVQLFEAAEEAVARERRPPHRLEETHADHCSGDRDRISDMVEA